MNTQLYISQLAVDKQEKLLAMIREHLEQEVELSSAEIELALAEARDSRIDDVKHVLPGDWSARLGLYLLSNY